MLTRKTTLALGGLLAMLVSGPAMAQDCTPVIPDSELIVPGTLTMSMNPTIPPAQFLDQDGQLKGVNVELQAELAKRLCLKSEIIRMQFGAMLPGLAAGRFDGINTSMFWTEERSKVAYLVPYGLQTITLAVLPDSDLKVEKEEEIAGLTISAEGNSYQERWLRGLDEKNVAAGLKPMEFRFFPTATEVMAALRAKQIDLAALIDYTANDMESRGLVKIITTDLAPSQTTFAFRSKVVADEIVKALNGMRADGFYDKLFAQWGMTPFPTDRSFAIGGPGPQ